MVSRRATDNVSNSSVARNSFRLDSPTQPRNSIPTLIAETGAQQPIPDLLSVHPTHLQSTRPQLHYAVVRTRLPHPLLKSEKRKKDAKMQHAWKYSIPLVLCAICWGVPQYEILPILGADELADTIGGACTGQDADNDFCAGAYCELHGTGSVYKKGTGAVKKWCASDAFPKTCNCTENNPPTVCWQRQTCANPGCPVTTCGPLEDQATVSTSVHLGGAPCTSDGDCEG